jgi:hypothetical protein
MMIVNRKRYITLKDSTYNLDELTSAALDDIQMTLRYAHLAPEHKARAVEKLLESSVTHRVA